MGAEGEHLLHSVLQGPRLLPSHDAAVSTSDLKAWCILGREKLNKLRRHTCSQQPQPGHEASVLLARTSHIPSRHPHDVGLGSVVQPCAQEEKTGLVVMVSLCHIQDTCSFILQLFFSLSSICCCLFKNDTSNTQKHACYTKSTETCTQWSILDIVTWSTICVKSIIHIKYSTIPSTGWELNSIAHHYHYCEDCYCCSFTSFRAVCWMNEP